MILGGTVSLPVRDVAASVRFYVETLGMKLVSEQPDASLIDAGNGFVVELRRGPSAGTGTVVTFFPKVPITEAVAIYENRGVAFGTTHEGGWVLARFADPDGNVLCLAQQALP